jgi:predicted dehydrogenase
MTSRRNFLSAAGAATVYSLAGQPAQLHAAAANDSVALGFVGIGIRGSQLMQEFAQVPGLRLVAAADLYDGYLAHGKEFTDGKLETTKRYEDIIGRRDIDAVVIATPDHWHKRITLEALSAGKHVFCEKPLTWSIEEGPEITAAEKRSGKVLMVGSPGKTSALAAKAKELIASNAIGKVTVVRMFNNRNTAEGAWVYPIPPDASPKTIDWERFIGPAPKRPFSPEVFFRWRCWWEYSGGVATDLFVHLLTTLHEVTGATAPSSVVSQGGLWFWKDGRTVPDVLESVFEYPQGFIAQMCVNLKNSAPAPLMTVYGSEGTLVWDREKLIVTPEPVDRDIQFYGTTAWPKSMREDYLKSKGVDLSNRRGAWPPPPESKEYKVDRGLGHGAQFIRALREGLPSPENGTEGHAAAGAAHVANMAYRKGKKMKWDFEANKVSAA